MRPSIAWALAVVVAAGGCRFDRSGLAPSGDASSVDRAADHLTVLVDAGLDAPLDGSPGSEARPDLQRPDGMPLDLLAPDLVSPCVTDHFATDQPGWAVSLLKGAWTWLPPTHAHHELPASGYKVGEALIYGSSQMLGAKLQGEATLSLSALYQNGNSHGAGLALLIKSNGSTSIADTLVACVVKQSSSTGVSGVSIWYFSGGSNSAKSLGNGNSPGTSLFQTSVKLTMTLVPSGWTSFTMSCELDAAGKLDSTSADISSYVDVPPVGVALVTFGATVDFDAFTLCP